METAQMGDTQLLDRESVISRFAAGPALLQAAIQGLTEPQLDLQLSPESWTIRLIIHHIADGDALWKGFLLQAAGDPGHQFSLEWYWYLPQDDWVKRWSYTTRQVGASLSLFTANRQHSVELVNHSPEIWDKCLPVTFRQNPTQLVSVGEVIEMQARHVEGHVADIHQVRTFHGV